MELRNKTKRPLRVPLPGGKKLHLGPGKSGQITPKAAEYPPVVKLVEAGDVEVVDGGRSQSAGGGDGRGAVRPTEGGPRTGGIRHIGDR